MVLQLPGGKKGERQLGQILKQVKDRAIDEDLKRFHRLVGLYATAFLLIFASVTISETVPEAEKSETKSIEAVRAETPPRIDGILDDECWKQAKPVTGFTQKQPDELQPAREQTFAYVAYDGDNLYLAFNCLASNPDKIIANITSHDGLSPEGPGSDILSYDDAVQVLLDTYHDGRNYFSFMVSAKGTQSEGKSSAGQFGISTVWDCIWDAKAKINDDGWSAEMAIPFSNLRFKSAPGEQIWGINFRRSEKAREEETYWSIFGESISDPRGYGILTGLRDLSVKRLVDIMPYFIASGTNKDGLEKSTGVDAEVLVTPNLTATATFNPDFGQIEADPEQFNLSRRELRLPEKRAFFREGLELLGTPMSVFYTRRMGDIKYGAKLAGKIGPTSVAALNVETRADEEEPMATFTAVRLKQGVMKAGAMGILAVNKRRGGMDNRILSLDGTFSLGENMRIGGQACKSYFPGMKDTAIKFSFHKESRRYFLYTEYEGVGPDFIAEPGIVTRTGEKRLFAVAGGDIQPRKYGIQRLGVFSTASMGMDYKNEMLNDGLEARLEMSLENKFSFAAGRDGGMDVLEETFHNNVKYIWMGYNTQEWASTEVSYMQGKNYGQELKRIRGSTKFKPTDSISVQLSVDNLRLDDTVNWIDIVRLTYQFSKEMSLRVFGQMSWGMLTVNTLFRYEYQPGSNVYIAYNQSEIEDGTDRVIFVKIAHVLGMYLVSD